MYPKPDSANGYEMGFLKENRTIPALKIMKTKYKHHRFFLNRSLISTVLIIQAANTPKSRASILHGNKTYVDMAGIFKNVNIINLHIGDKMIKEGKM